MFVITLFSLLCPALYPYLYTYTYIYLSTYTYIYLYTYNSQGSNQNLKQVSQNSMKAFHVDDVTLRFQLMASYRKINIASENIIDYRVYFPN